MFSLGTAVAFMGETYTVIGRRRYLGGLHLYYTIRPVSGGRDQTVSSLLVSEVGTADAENTAVDEGWVPAVPSLPVSCTGSDEDDGLGILHDGDTCPVHEND